MFLYTSKFTEAFSELQKAKGWDTIMSGYLAQLTLATTLTCAIESKATLKQIQNELDRLTETYKAELKELQNEKVGA